MSARHFHMLALFITGLFLVQSAVLWQRTVPREDMERMVREGDSLILDRLDGVADVLYLESRRGFRDMDTAIARSVLGPMEDILQRLEKIEAGAEHTHKNQKRNHLRTEYELLRLRQAVDSVRREMYRLEDRARF